MLDVFVLSHFTCLFLRVCTGRGLDGGSVRSDDPPAATAALPSELNTPQDWEQHLRSSGCRGWRVSQVNELHQMCLRRVPGWYRTPRGAASSGLCHRGEESDFEIRLS